MDSTAGAAAQVHREHASFLRLRTRGRSLRFVARNRQRFPQTADERPTQDEIPVVDRLTRRLSFVSIVMDVPQLPEARTENQIEHEAAPEKTTVEVCTQTPSSTRKCSYDHEMVCAYLDRLVTREDKQGELVPVDLMCHITQQAMRDPVIADDGNTYERSAIEQWLMRSSTSPVSREPISDCLTFNRTVYNLTERWARELAIKGLGKQIESLTVKR